MATDRLKLYNGALQAIGERRLASLSENRKPRRELDFAWDNGAVQYCLEQGYWNFAVNTIMLDKTPSIEPAFGYKYAFDKPLDYVKTLSFSSDEYFNNPIINYADETEFWYCDLPTVYIQYVSNSDQFGMNYAAWTEAFTDLVQLYLASQVVFTLTQNEGLRDRIDMALKKALLQARNQDAMNQPTQYIRTGNWVRSRMAGNRDRSFWDGRQSV